jgi:ATP-binding cassette, subfamily F, member 3
MITIKNISLEFLNQTIFKDFSATFSLNDRIGIVGPNGAGKSTLLKVIAGIQKPDNGSILLGQNKIAYLPQEVVLNSDKSVLDEAFSGFESGLLFQKQQHLDAQLKINPNDKDTAEQLLIVSHELSEHNITKDLQDTKRVLTGLGFSEQQLNQNVNQLSVGWKMRLLLAKLLLKKADFYLFDEPTNHLDITTKEWFMEFLQNSETGFLLISHERYFLNELCQATLSLENGNSQMYYGNYDFFEKEKKEEIERLKQAQIVQQKDIAQKKITINRFRASATKAKMVQKIIRELEKIEPIVLPPEPKTIRLPFGDIEKSNKKVLNLNNIDFGYEKNNMLFKNVNFEIERGQKIAIVAPNGKGKTTLFKVITQKLIPQNGSIEFGENTTYAIFEQDEYSSLNMNKNIFEEVSESVDATYESIRSFLGAFLFDSESIKKKIKVLSGGEKNRVKLVKALLKKTNLLLLDEPTNHLDIPSKDVLVKALQDFPGTILFVSHDRDFINKVASHVIDLQENGSFMYQGNYDDFLDQTKDQKINQNTEFKKDNTSNSKSSKKNINEIERNISKLEGKIKTQSERFANLEYGTPEFDNSLKLLQTHEKELEELIASWERMQSK